MSLGVPENPIDMNLKKRNEVKCHCFFLKSSGLRVENVPNLGKRHLITPILIVFQIPQTKGVLMCV